MLDLGGAKFPKGGFLGFGGTQVIEQEAATAREPAGEYDGTFDSTQS
jgi:type I site-specific restriction-modification system R (restriction) subunit